MISLTLLIAAIVLLFLAAFNVPSGKISLGWLGLALWALSTTIVKLL